jgi:hypothetical protein
LGHHFFHFSRVLGEFFHLAETQQEIVYLSDGIAAAAGDALATARVENLGALPFAGRHRENDRLDSLQFFSVY